MVKAGVITVAQLEDAIKLAGNKRLQLGQMLIMAGNISPRDLQAAVDAQSMLRDRTIDQSTATRCLKIACKTGMNFADVIRDQQCDKSDSLSNKLGELLLEAGLVDREQFGKSMQRSLATGLPLGRILVLNGAISEILLNTALEIQVRIRDGMLTRVEAVEALRAQAGEIDPQEAQRQTVRMDVGNPPRKSGIRLGELMVMAGMLNETDVMSALELGLVKDIPIGQVLVEQGFLSEEMLQNALELQHKVDAGLLQPTEAGQALAKMSATGITIDEALDEFVQPEDEIYEQLNFDKMLILARVCSQADIEEALSRATQNPQLLAKVLNAAGYINDVAETAILQCHSMMANNFLSQDDAIIALDYCMEKSVERNISFGQALQELGWSPVESLQMQAQNSVDITHIKLQAAVVGEVTGESLAQGGAIANEDRAASVKDQQSDSKRSGAWLPAAEEQVLRMPEDPQSSHKAALKSAESYEQDFDRMSGEHAILQGSNQEAVKEEHEIKEPAAGAASAEAESEPSPEVLRDLFKADPPVSGAESDAASNARLKVDSDLPANGKDTDLSSGWSAGAGAAAGESNNGGNSATSTANDLPLVAPANEQDAREELKEALGSALHRLAQSYYEQGDYTEAQGLYERILVIKQQQLGPKDPGLAADLTNLAGVLCIQGKFDQAEPFVKRVVNIIETAVPLDVLKLADSMNTLAGILYQQAKYEECEPYLERSLKLRQQRLGPYHPEVADNLRDYAKLLRKLKRDEEAEQMYLQAREILAK